MTNEVEQAHATEVGWEVIRLQRAPVTYLWLAEHGWEGGWQIRADRHSDTEVAVTCSYRIEEMKLAFLGYSLS